MNSLSPLRRFISAYVGRKMLMAVTGLLLVGFLLTHLLGNLLILKSPDTFNHYAHALVSNPLIIVAELGLIALFLVHLLNGIAITLKNRAARPVAYRMIRAAGGPSRKSLSSRTMILTGLAILIFLPIHIIDFKYGTHYTDVADPKVRDLAKLVIEEFSEPGEAIFYAVTMLLIGLHLWHGFGSAFESLGFRYRKGLHRLGHLLAVVIALGFALIPLAIYWCSIQGQCPLSQ